MAIDAGVHWVLFRFITKLHQRERTNSLPSSSSSTFTSNNNNNDISGQWTVQIDFYFNSHKSFATWTANWNRNSGICARAKDMPWEHRWTNEWIDKGSCNESTAKLYEISIMEFLSNKIESVLKNNNFSKFFFLNSVF